MAEKIKKELILDKIVIKEEELIIEEEICSSSSLEETCTWDVQEEDVKMENTEIKGKVPFQIAIVLSNSTISPGSFNVRKNTCRKFIMTLMCI